MITQEQLEHILANPESYRAELTTSKNEMDKFCQAICAFANDLPGDGKYGYLILGAHDNGKLSGLRVDDELLKKISNIRTDGNILPQPNYGR
jgi:ATP-dependent DNA helicase RecG